MADYFVAYAKKIAAPVRCGVEVTDGRRASRASAGSAWRRRRARSRPTAVVAATGAVPAPDHAGDGAGRDGHRCRCTRPPTAIPAQLPPGAVLVVGCGLVRRADRRRTAGRRGARSTCRSGRTTGRRAPIAGATSAGGWACWANGMRRRATPGTEHVTIAVSGANGGHTVDFRAARAEGHDAAWAARAAIRERRDALCAATSRHNLDAGRCQLAVGAGRGRRLCRPQRSGPAAGAARRARSLPDADCVTEPDPVRSTSREAGITTIIWATGFAPDYGWLKVDTFDETGRPRHQRGVSAEPGHLFPGPALAVAARLESSSGASGTMPSTSRTRSPSSAATWPITGRRAASDRANAEDTTWPTTATASSTPRTPIPSRSWTTTWPRPWYARRHDRLAARAVPAGPGHRQEHRQP